MVELVAKLASVQRPGSHDDAGGSAEGTPLRRTGRLQERSRRPRSSRHPDGGDVAQAGRPAARVHRRRGLRRRGRRLHVAGAFRLARARWRSRTASPTAREHSRCGSSAGSGCSGPPDGGWWRGTAGHLAEMVCIPHALLANPQLEWRELDAGEIEVTGRTSWSGSSRALTHWCIDAAAGGILGRMGGSARAAAADGGTTHRTDPTTPVHNLPTRRSVRRGGGQRGGCPPAGLEPQPSRAAPQARARVGAQDVGVRGAQHRGPERDDSLAAAHCCDR